MYPELFRIGDFPINTYGVLLAVAMLCALFVASRLAEREGIPSGRIYDLGLWVIVGGLLGSKILLMLTEDNVQFFSLDFLRSGGVYFGGFLGGFIALVVLVRFYQLPFLKVADAFAPGVALGQAIGRLGCFAAGDSWGNPTDLPWGVRFTQLAHANTGVPIYAADGSDLYLHPTQLYESLTMFIVFGLLVLLHRRKRFNGQVLIAYAMIYALARFTIEFWRGDPRGDLLGLTTFTGLSTSQLISLLVAGGAVVFLILRTRKRRTLKFLPTASMVVVSAAVFTAPANAQDEKPVRVETKLVNVNVSVTDKQGNPIKGLKKEQFEIFDNRVRQQIAHFSDEESPVSFGVVFDLRPVTGERTITVLEALRNFTKQLAAKDDFFVLTFDERGSFIFDFVPTEVQIRTQLSGKRGGPNSLYDAICLAAEKVAEKIREKDNRKPTLLVISDGADRGSRHDFGEMQKHLLEFDAQIYAVVFDKNKDQPPALLDVVRERRLRVNISKDGAPLDRAAIEELTKTSGGIYHASAMKNSLEIYEMLKHGADDARRQYAIGFYPVDANGKRHKLKINVLSAGENRRLFASYRRGYTSPSNILDK
jgi:phosphatidylglycerol---prolipoprotein diacylglyceryl transferase